MIHAQGTLDAVMTRPQRVGPQVSSDLDSMPVLGDDSVTLVPVGKLQVLELDLNAGR